ncbi:MOSC domain containing protein [Beauveria brongniartii RCEF 3172]|uniref:MOSC domain containing protein n=1 Tax=Beauveria brongniartii RCEF 3172 TaxID=1081107 RepID=A0A167FTF1_9HYPO|nr:MOSC domain containing protein [Beauveria brongniartii RCEF 3172]
MTSRAAEIASLLDVSSVFLFLVTLVVFSIPVFIIFPPIPVERSDALGQTHSKVGIPERESNLRDQYAGTNGHVATGQQRAAPRIHSLHIYPLKSCRGIELAEATLLPKGLEHDRVFCLAQLKSKRRTRPGAATTTTTTTTTTISAAADVTSASSSSSSSSSVQVDEYWETLTLRNIAHMANVKVDLWVPDASKHSRQLGPTTMAGDDGSGGGNSFMVVRFPWRSPGVKGIVETVAAKLSRGLSAAPEREFMLPMSFPSPDEVKTRGYSQAQVTHFRSVIPALNMGSELPMELALYLGLEPQKLTLFRLDPAHRRQVLGSAPTLDVAGYQPEIDFQDAYPLHLLNLSSVRALESKIRRDADIDRLDCRRFRPNIIVSGLPEYDEDDWRSVQFKAVRGQDADSLFDVSCRTVRCKLPNVDPATGIRHKVEPDHALRHYREIDAGAPKKGCMGMQMCPLFPKDVVPPHLTSTIRVGMEVVVLKRGTHHAL